MADVENMTETEGEQDINLILISLVRSEKYIYDLHDKSHKDRNLLARTWTRIGSELGISGEGM